jgi:hypothetical protein
MSHKQKKSQREIQRIEAEATGCPMCDGCGKQIATGSTFWKFYARESGEDAWGNCYFDIELHAHQRLTCEAKVMRKTFE